MKSQVNGKITSTSSRISSRIYAEIRINKKRHPNFPHKKGKGLPVNLLIGSSKHQTVIRERHKLDFFWISQKRGLWELLKKNGYSLNDSLTLNVNTAPNPIEIIITPKITDVKIEKRIRKSSYFPDDIGNKDIPHTEGAVKKISINAFERNNGARNECLKEYGYKCIACGFDFEKKYGEAGKGFIHVHHLVPLSEIRESYVVDGKKDLCPICPNCHAIIHRYDPYLTIEELKALIKDQEIPL